MKYSFKIILGVFLYAICSCNDKIDKRLNDQSLASPVEVYLKEFDFYFYPDSCAEKKVVPLIGDQGQLMADIYDCRGKMKFKLVDKLGNIIVEGAYINSLDTLKKYSIKKSAIDGSREITVTKYFQPLADGSWIYFKDGKESSRKIYKNGVLIDPLN